MVLSDSAAGFDDAGFNEDGVEFHQQPVGVRTPYSRLLLRKSIGAGG